MAWRGRPRRTNRVQWRRLGMASSRVPGRGLHCRIAETHKAIVGLIFPASTASFAVAGLLEGFCPEPRLEEQLAVNAGGRLLLLRLADIDVVQAEANGVALHVGREVYVLSDSLAAIGAKLPPGLFRRIGVSSLVNVRQVKGLRRLCQGEWQVLLRSGSRLPPLTSLGEAAVLLAEHCTRAVVER